MSLTQTPLPSPQRFRVSVAIFVVTFLVPLVAAPPIARLVGRDVDSVVNRILMLGCVVSLIVLAGPSLFRGGGRWMRQEFPRAALRMFLAAVITLVICVGFTFGMIALGYAQPRPDDPGEYAWKMVGYASSGFFVGLIEEAIFRGLLWRQLGARIGLLASGFVISALYSWLHFIKPPKGDAGEPGVAEVLVVYENIVHKLLAPLTQPTAQAWAQFLGLFLFGVLLTLLVHRSGRLATAMGVHAAVVFFIKGDGKIVSPYHRGYDWWMGSRFYYDGAVAQLVLLAMILVVWQPWRRRSTEGTPATEVAVPEPDLAPDGEERSTAKVRG